MRKLQQKNILELLSTIEDLQSNGLYADCQEGALAVGNYIEEVEGEGTKTVALLEDYCEALFKASNGEISDKVLRKHLISVENSVRQELKPTQIEVVFFPYQLSMWDSLESIYLAAKEDPNCEAFVVPIPYYEWNPDGSQGKMHYDGDQYPECIGAVNWQSYDVESRRPDIIFIHYAYDDMTANASVHPDFFSKRLRVHCEKLVYVPYYVTSDNCVEDYYGFLPGVLNSHYVIARSEIEKQNYIKHYKKYDKENGWKGRFGKAEEKFIAIGSPKIDKVINSKRENFTLPDEWEKLLTKTDGTRKKAILYNTHMFTWLNSGDLYFKKIQSVFDKFRNRDDVVIWWRPHPNTEVNFRTQRPHLLNSYYEVVADYLSSGFGIYDDTPDLHRAITWSDAYYGDPSSLVALYEVTGKPVMIQDARSVSDEGCPPMSVMHVTDEDIWYSTRNVNALFKMRRSDGQVEHIGSFPDEKEATGSFDPLYIQIAENKGVLYFAPFFAKEIAAYSKLNNEFRKIPFNNAGEEEKSVRAFIGAVAYGKYVFFTPCAYPAIMRLDTETDEIVYFADWVEPLKKLADGIQQLYFSGAPFVVGNTIWMASCCTNAIIAFDMETSSCCVYSVGEKEYRYSSISYDGENFWMIPNGGANSPIVKWNPTEGVIKEFPKIYEGIAADRLWYSALCFAGFLWLLPAFDGQAYKIDVNTNVISIADEFTDGSDSNVQYTSVQIHGDRIFAYHGQNMTIVDYQYKNNKRKETVVYYSAEIEKWFDECLTYLFKQVDTQGNKSTTSSLIDERFVRLTDLISNMTVSSKNECDTSSNSKYQFKDAGTSIYETVKQELERK